MRIDARGMRCPWPAIRLARALREGAEAVEMLLDDAADLDELARAAVSANADITLGKNDYCTVCHVVKRIVVNRSFTPRG